MIRTEIWVQCDECGDQPPLSIKYPDETVEAAIVTARDAGYRVKVNGLLASYGTAIPAICPRCWKERE